MADPPWWDRAGHGGYGIEVILGREEAARQIEQRGELTALPVIEMTEADRLTPPVVGQALLAVTVGTAGELVALWCAETDLEVFTIVPGRRGRDWPGSRASRPAPVIVTAHRPDDGMTVIARIPTLELTYPVLAATSDGGVLIVSAECELTAHGPERNALVIGRTGEVVDRVTIGDGIEHVQTTPTGHVWVGYGDTGIFGNNGWGGRDSPDSAGEVIEPIGKWGLVRFDGSFAVEWEFGRSMYEAQRAGALIERTIIDHVAALNVVGETAWAYVFSDVGVITRVQDDDIRTWQAAGLEGAGVLLAADDRQALVGGYGPEYDRFVTGHLEPGRFVQDATRRLVLPDGTDLPTASRRVGRGPTLHVIADSRWFRLDL